MRRLSILVAGTALLAFPAPPGAAQDLKETVNQSVRALRSVQNADGSYGTSGQQPLATARVLQALGDCGERYTTADGPFVRGAVRFLLDQQRADGSITRAGATAQETLALTAEGLLALRSAAPAAEYEESRRRAAAFLAAAEAPDGATAALVARALGTAQSGTFPHLSRLLSHGDAGAPPQAGPAARELAAELDAAQQESLAVIAPASAAAVADRLLALLDLESQLEKPRGAAETLPLPPQRELPQNAAEELARIAAALRFLDGAQRDGRFGFGGHEDPGITAIALAAALRTADAFGLERPAYVAAGLDWLVSLQQEDGGIYLMGLKNYVTSVAVEALTASGDERFAPAIARAVAFLRATQLDEDEGYSVEEDPYYGGFGYGSSEKPDLSNTQMALQALHDAGLPGQDEAFAKAVRFLEKCQNRAETGLDSMTQRDGTVIVAGTDGGAVYRPGDSKAGTDRLDGGKAVARSYGSMTYALLKSYLFAGLDPADPRVADAVAWISRNFTVETNPGFAAGQGAAPYQGLFYYYLTMARALNACALDTIEDAAGRTRDWRAELSAMLYSLQAPEGEWTNQRSPRWMEANPVLATAYALLALAEIRVP